MNRTKTMSYPTPPPSTGTRAAADRMAGQSRRGESQQAAGARARAMARDCVRRSGGKPYDAG